MGSSQKAWNSDAVGVSTWSDCGRIEASVEMIGVSVGFASSDFGCVLASWGGGGGGSSSGVDIAGSAIGLGSKSTACWKDSMPNVPWAILGSASTVLSSSGLLVPKVIGVSDVTECGMTGG